MNGYGSESYVRSLCDPQSKSYPLALPRSGGWVISRAVPGESWGSVPYRDASGCYPLFCCDHWESVRDDLEAAGREHGIISAVLVTDTFGHYTPTMLMDQFDLVTKFKDHYVTDLSRPLESFVSKNHRRHANRVSSCGMELGIVEEPRTLAREWVKLYGNLIKRHDIRGETAFSPLTLSKQLEVPGLVMFRAMYGNVPASMLLWYVQGNVAYYHLGASSEIGYRWHASYGLFWMALEHFASMGLDWADLGAAPGTDSSAEHPLASFKRGWSNLEMPVYLCGAILDRKIYDALAWGHSTDFFPAYRRWVP